MANASDTLTFLFTDIEGSTRLWERQSGAMSHALARHDALVRAAIESHGGAVFKTVGDAFHAAFPTAATAVAASVAIQRALAAEPWGDTPIAVRCALHAGTAEHRDGDYFGPTLNRVARLLAAAHGGQVLLSQAAAALAGESGTGEWDTLDLGRHRLRDLDREEHVFQLIHPALRRDFPPIKTLRARHDSIPARRAALIGRDAERDELCALLMQPDVRLLTITGPGGCGKTTLAIDIAAEAIDHFEDGACFVPLAAIADPALIVPAIAQALGLREGDQPFASLLREYVTDKSLLLVLDNFEQVLDAAPFVGELMAASGVKIIVTSRAPLHLSFEREYALPALRLPATPALAAVRESPAVALFVERARAADPSLQLTEGNAAAIAAICRRLDGLPLAIEQAASRARLLAPEAMLQRLESGLGVLAGGARDLPARQQTMRATIAWSHDLLDAGERALFRRLGAFSGGFTLDAAEDVCALDPADDVLAVLASLLDKSLVHTAEASAGADRRFGMLETIREFALEQLAASGELATVRERHAAWCGGFAARARDEIHGPRQLAWLASCEEEHENMRAALAWLAERRDTQGLRLAVALAPFWRLHSHLREGLGWLSHMQASAGESIDEQLRAETLLWSALLASHAGDHETVRASATAAMDAAKAAQSPALQGRITTPIGWNALVRGDYTEALDALTRAVELLRGTDDVWGLAEALHFLGHAQADATGLVSARAAWDESLRLFRELGDGWSQAQPLKDLGLIAARTGDHAAARASYEESLALLYEIGDKWHVADTLARLGELAMLDGDLAQASERLEEALAVARDLDNRFAIVEILMRAAETAQLLRDYAGAREKLDEARAISERVASERMVAASLHNLAYLEIRDGKLDAAERMVRTAIALNRKLGRDLEVALDIAALGAVCAARGQHAEAARLLGAADTLHGEIGVMLTRTDRLEFVVDHDQLVGSIRAALGEEAFAAADAAGRALARDEILRMADELARDSAPVSGG